VSISQPFPKHLLAPRYWPTWLGLGLLRIIAWLPYPIQTLSGHGLGIIIWLLPLPQKKIIRINIKHCFPELSLKQQKNLLFNNCLSMGMSLVEIAMSWWSSTRQLKKLVSIEGIEHLQQALNEKHGVILLSPHFTTLEIGGRLLSLSAPFHVMFRDQKNAAFDYIMTQSRQRNFKKAIHRNDIKGLLTSLKNNMPVWYAPDQHFGGANNVVVPFFNQPAPTNPATSRIAKISQAKVVPFFQERLPGLKGYRLAILPALTNYPAENNEQDSAQINLVLEQLIRMRPEQYLWAHKRFKGQPGDTNTIYSKPD